MLKIRKAAPADAQDIYELTQKAFVIYQEALGSSSIITPALKETIEDVLYDIQNNTILVAQDDNGKILGSIRMKALSEQLAYIYRFGVEPQSSNNGVGSEILAAIIDLCIAQGFLAIALHTNAKYYKLAKYYYGKEFYVHSTDMSKGYIRALFVKDLSDKPADLSPAFKL